MNGVTGIFLNIKKPKNIKNNNIINLPEYGANCELNGQLTLKITANQFINRIANVGSISGCQAKA